MTAPDPSASSGTSTATIVTQYAYDDAHQLCRVVENATGSTDLQALANPCSTATQTAGTTTTNLSSRYTYDGAANLASMIDAAGNTTTYAYDAAGHVTGRTDALGAGLTWTYDDMGNRAAQRNRTDTIPTWSVTWTYDPSGRILTRTADAVTTTYTYDAAGNQLTASTAGQAITSTYDRLDRPLTVDDEDAGTTDDTTYDYPTFTSASRIDVTGSYAVTLDAFGRQTAVNDPVNASAFTWAYQGDGLVASFGQPNGNMTAFAYDRAGHPLSKDTTAGATNRGLYDWTYNRAGQVLTEATTITGDPTNNTRSFASDPLARLASFTDGATTTAYGWPAVTNRTSVQVGAGPAVPTGYDAANRPTTQNGVSGAYSSDADGRLTARPTTAGAAYQQLSWDRLGRLTAVKNGSGTTLATYTYDPLDRLRMVDYGAGTRVRFRYQGTTTSAVQTINDATSTVISSIGTAWSGELLEDWTGAGSNLRIYGTNAHHDVTWAASSTGAVTGTARYDPWGTPTTITGSVPDFRFQSSWADDTTKLSWVVRRWYASVEGRFLSEDSLLGQPDRPASRHLFAYAEGNPITSWDPDGRCSGTTTYFNLYGHACSRSYTTSFQNTGRFHGSVRIALFIPYQSIKFYGVQLKGDNRDFSQLGSIDFLRTRVGISVNFDHGSLYAIARPSCGVDTPPTNPGECADAYAWTDLMAAPLVWLNAAKVEHHSLAWRPKGCDQTSTKIRWSVRQSKVPLPSPTIDGSLEVWNCNGFTNWKLDTDGFPSFEMEWMVGGSIRRLHRIAASTNPDDLLALKGDMHDRWDWPDF